MISRIKMCKYINCCTFTIFIKLKYIETKIILKTRDVFNKTEKKSEFSKKIFPKKLTNEIEKFQRQKYFTFVNTYTRWMKILFNIYLISITNPNSKFLKASEFSIIFFSNSSNDEYYRFLLRVLIYEFCLYVHAKIHVSVIFYIRIASFWHRGTVSKAREGDWINTRCKNSRISCNFEIEEGKERR